MSTNHLFGADEDLLHRPAGLANRTHTLGFEFEGCRHPPGDVKRRIIEGVDLKSLVLCVGFGGGQDEVTPNLGTAFASILAPGVGFVWGSTNAP